VRPGTNTRQIWDPRTKEAIDTIETDFPITAVAASEAGHELYSGGVDPDIKVWDLRKKVETHSLLGHLDIVTSLQASPDGQMLLSNSMDNTARTWDIRPFAPGNRLVNTFDGSVAGIERTLVRATWDPESKKIAAGSGDRTVTIWDANNPSKLLSKLPGHKGTVTDVRFHPTEPISKSTVFLFECRLPSYGMTVSRALVPRQWHGVVLLRLKVSFIQVLSLRSLGAPSKMTTALSTPTSQAPYLPWI
jgi:WD40 repeat protein